MKETKKKRKKGIEKIINKRIEKASKQSDNQAVQRPIVTREFKNITTTIEKQLQLPLTVNEDFQKWS